jgi:predicted anti-sigma-YlaC factor YlaD
MHCLDATRTMSAVQEHELTAGERVSLQSHLAVCPQCREFERQVAFLRDSMRTYARRPDDADDLRDDHNASSE